MTIGVTPLVYRLEDGGYRLISYGRDGRPGGEGIDADFTNKDDWRSLPPLTVDQFVRSEDGMVMWYVLSAVATVVLCLTMGSPFRKKPWPKWAYLGAVLATCAGMTYVAFYIGLIHVKTGH